MEIESFGDDAACTEQREPGAAVPSSSTPGALPANDGPSAFQPLHAQLGRFVALTADETRALDRLPHRLRLFRPEEIMVHEGDDPDSVYLILQGFAYRYKLLSDGHRQILGYLLPGDLCDAEFAEGNRADHCVAALNEAVAAVIPSTSIVEIRTVYPNIDSALALVALAERSILRHWLLNVGQRNAVQRITHFLCELALRLHTIGHRNPDDSIDVPISQTALADSTGMTTVHVNRTLRRLRKDGLIEVHRNRLTIIDAQRLAHLADFDGDYLHPGRYAG